METSIILSGEAWNHQDKVFCPFWRKHLSFALSITTFQCNPVSFLSSDFIWLIVSISFHLEKWKNIQARSWRNWKIKESWKYQQFTTWTQKLCIARVVQRVSQEVVIWGNPSYYRLCTIGTPYLQIYYMWLWEGAIKTKVHTHTLHSSIDAEQLSVTPTLSSVVSKLWIFCAFMAFPQQWSPWNLTLVDNTSLL
jgi:hypothetical protein